MSKVRKAVIPAAGMGTRFLPATKAMPKEMLPVADKPVIQYVVEDAVSAGIEDIIIVTGWHKRTLEDHFDEPYELIARLKDSGKEKQIEQVRRIANMATFTYIRQKGPYGTATPILNVKHLVGNEPFLYLFGDDFFVADPTRSAQLLTAFDTYQAPILAGLRTNNPEDTHRYGYVAGDEVSPGVFKVTDIIEKPGPDRAPSDLAVMSGYVFTPEFYTYMEQVRPQPGQELMYVDGIKNMLDAGGDVYAVEIQGGRYYDCGNKLEYLKANIEISLEHEEYAAELRKYLKDLTI